MKKTICFSMLILLFFSGCDNSFSMIDYSDVEKIIIRTHQSEREASEDEASSIIELYNASKYGGKATGEGGTPDFGARIVLKNGNEIRVNDFYGKVEVFAPNKAFYLESQELYEMIKEAASA